MKDGTYCKNKDLRQSNVWTSPIGLEVAACKTSRESFRGCFSLLARHNAVQDSGTTNITLIQFRLSANTTQRAKDLAREYGTATPF